MPGPELDNQHGYICPKCKGGASLAVAATIWADLLPDGTDNTNSDTTWDDSSGAKCACGWSGTVADLEHESGTDPEPAPLGVVVEVLGGAVVEVHGVKAFELLDWDVLLGDMASAGDAERGWRKMSPALQIFVQAERPEEYRKLLLRRIDDAETCDCAERSWYGSEHDSACSLAGLPRV